jgi:hypothetical protein
MKRFQLFQNAFSEIELGGGILHEFVMFSYDVPISKHFMPSVFATFSERYRDCSPNWIAFQVGRDLY